MRNEILQAQAYIESLIAEETPSKRKSRFFAEELGLGQICLSPSEGRLLSFLIRLSGCRKFVEIGTLTGLSAQYILDGMEENGQLWCLEKSDIHAAKAKESLSEHPAGRNVQMIVGDARVTLESLSSTGPFDGVFIDGNKAAYGDYLDWAEKNVRQGGLIIADNIFLSGAVWGAREGQSQKFSEKQIRVMQEFNQRLANQKLYNGVIIPTKEGMHVSVKLF